MKRLVLAALTLGLTFGVVTPSSAQEPKTATAGTTLGSVTFSRKVMADGQPLAPGTYQVRLSADQPKAVVGESPDSERYVEFVKAGKVVGREVATVLSNAEMASMGKYPKPVVNGARVETLRGGDYIRVWINHSGSNYLIHLPPGA